MSGAVDNTVGEGFSKTAGDYDDAVRFNIHGAERLVGALPVGEYRDVLDVGCGTGFSAFAMAERFGPLRLTGIDSAEGMLDQFRAKLESRPDVSATLHRADVLEMPVEDASYDAVICSMAFHWFPRKRDAMVAMARPLRPGGVLGVLCSGTGGEGEFREVLARLEPPAPRWVGAFDVVQRDIPDMEAYAAAAGLEPVDIWMERRIRRVEPRHFLERMRVVAGHVASGLPAEDLASLNERVAAGVTAASGPHGFEYTFNKLFAVLRQPG